MSKWPVKKLGEVLSLIRNGISCKQNKNGIGSPISRIETIAQSKIDYSRIGYAELDEAKKEKFKLTKGDILFSHINSVVHVGKTAHVASDIELYHGMNLLLFRCSELVTPRWLNAYLSSIFEAGYWRSICKQSVNQASVNQTDIKKVSIPIPPLAEQERIVGILDEAFEGIATATAHAEHNLQNARELFQSVLQSTFQQNGEDWVETTLGETLETQPRNGWSPPAANHSDSGIPVLTLSSVTGFIFRPEKIKHTSAETDPSRHYWVRSGDFLITRSNTPELVGHVAIAESIDTPTIYPDLIMRMIPSPDKAVTKFLYWQLRTITLREIIKGRASGANPTMKKINKAAVQTLPVSLPPLKTQKAIVKKLDALSTETRRLEALYQRKLTALAELKQSLLQRAFAGEL